jgi:hypothetical protein
MGRSPSIYWLASVRPRGAAVKEHYVPIRPGIAEHLLRGDISTFEFGVYVIVHLQADYRKGIWRGSAPRILNSAPRGAKLREVQRALEHLAELGLLKHFHKPGQRGNFPFLINKFTVRSGALKGKRLNADKSDSWQSPVYEFCADDDADDSADVRAEDAPIQEVRSKREQGRKPPAAKTAPPADPRFQPFVVFAHRSFQEKHNVKPSWLEKDFSQLKRLLKANVSLDGGELERRWRAYLDSTEPFTSKQGDSLGYFASRCDRFSNGPISQPKGKSNGKDTNDAVATTMQGYAVNSGITH